MKKVIFSLLLSATFVATTAHADTQSDLTNKINELKTQVQSKTDEKSTADNDINTKNKEIEQLKNQLGQSKKSVDKSKITNQIESLKGKRAETSDEIEAREKMLKGTFSLGKLKEASNASEFFNELGEIVSGKDSKLESLKSQESNLNTQVSNLNSVSTKVDKSNKSIEAEKKSVQTTIDSKKAEVEQLNAKKAQLDNEINELNGQVSKTENDLQAEKAKAAKPKAKAKAEAKASSAESSTPVASFSDPADQELFNKVKDVVDSGDEGLTTHTRQMRHFLMAKFGISDAGGVRPDDDGTGHGHGSGLAVDFMADKATGDALSAYVAKNFSSLGVYYQIWQQRYYMNMSNIYGPANTWNYMPDRGGTTANHMDHVHISFAY